MKVRVLLVIFSLLVVQLNFAQNFEEPTKGIHSAGWSFGAGYGLNYSYRKDGNGFQINTFPFAFSGTYLVTAGIQGTFRIVKKYKTELRIIIGPTGIFTSSGNIYNIQGGFGYNVVYPKSNFRLEFGLLMILLMHIVNAVTLTISNNKQKPSKYLVSPTKTSSINSRTMIISGTIILLFFIIHLKYLWYTYQTHNFKIDETYYDVILRNEFGYLGHTPTAIFYVLAILFIAMHIKHGFQSALKTFGILEKSKFSFLYKIAIIFWAIIPALFILIILLIQFGYIK